MSTPPSPEYVLTLSCPDAAGIVFAVASLLVELDCSIESSQQYGDPATERFFMRVQFAGVQAAPDPARLEADVAALAARFGMTYTLRRVDRPTRVLVMVSQYGHCLNDLLYRQSVGALPIEIPAIVSNHTTFESLAASYGVTFHHVPVTAQTKPAAEARMHELVAELDIDLVVLARYMQVLSDDACSRLAGRAINIHHSFLPSFKGARPYHQAHDRGVKLIGATAHYVTAELDEGPIIEQEVARVDHSSSPEQLAAVGRDLESQALARAVLWHAEDRVLLNGHRTVVFR